MGATETNTTAGGGAAQGKGAGNVGVKPLATDAKAQADAPDVQQSPTESKYWVDGRPVSEEEYFKAAEGAGWIPSVMRAQGSFPNLSTKAHGK